MANKEWLKDIRKLLVNLYNAADVDEKMKHYIFNDLKIEWLVEQAERVQSLEYYKKDWMLVVKQNKRYREALEKIKFLYPLGNVGYQMFEIRKIAIEAMEGDLE